VAAPQFVAKLGAAMAGANYPVTMVRSVMEQTARAYGLDHEFLALPNYVQVGSASGEGIYIANPDFTVRYDQSFPLATLVARAPQARSAPRRASPSSSEFVTWTSDFRCGSRSSAMRCKASAWR
jgi:hypothetical protein